MSIESTPSPSQNTNLTPPNQTTQEIGQQIAQNLGIAANPTLTVGSNEANNTVRPEVINALLFQSPPVLPESRGGSPLTSDQIGDMRGEIDALFKDGVIDSNKLSEAIDKAVASGSIQSRMTSQDPVGNFLDFMRMLFEVAKEQVQDSIESKQISLQGQLDAIASKADKMMEQAATILGTGIASGAIQMGGAGLSLGVVYKGTNQQQQAGLEDAAGQQKGVQPQDAADVGAAGQQKGTQPQDADVAPQANQTWGEAKTVEPGRSSSIEIGGHRRPQDADVAPQANQTWGQAKTEPGRSPIEIGGHRNKAADVSGPGGPQSKAPATDDVEVSATSKAVSDTPVEVDAMAKDTSAPTDTAEVDGAGPQTSTTRADAGADASAPMSAEAGARVSTLYGEAINSMTRALSSMVDSAGQFRQKELEADITKEDAVVTAAKAAEDVASGTKQSSGDTLRGANDSLSTFTQTQTGAQSGIANI